VRRESCDALLRDQCHKFGVQDHLPQRDSRGRGGGRRGLTLLELLIVIALLLALGALSLPAIQRTLEDRAFETAVEVTTSQLLLARAHAQVSGEPVEVRYRSPRPNIVAVRFDPSSVIVSEAADEFRIDDAAEADETSDSATRQAIDPWTAMPDEDDEPLELIDAGWSYRDLPDGVWVSLEAPEDLMDAMMPARDIAAFDTDFAGFDPPPDPYAMDDPFRDDGPPGDQDDPRTIRLAVFLPDGSAILCSRVCLRGRDDRAGWLEVNPWTGLPSFGPVERDVDDVPDEEDTNETEEPADADAEDVFEFERGSASPESPVSAAPAPMNDADGGVEGEGGASGAER
jgi:prepilin-type N-terminal cleavage/methylation domain-containing protein